jgi:putative oxidoreductase
VDALSVDTLLLVGRLITGTGFAIIGLINIGNLVPLAELMRSRGLPLPGIVAGMGVGAQIILGAMLALGLRPLVASLGLAVFVIAATAIAHWPLSGSEAQRKENVIACLVNTILLGGLLTQASLALLS